MPVSRRQVENRIGAITDKLKPLLGEVGHVPKFVDKGKMTELTQSLAFVDTAKERKKCSDAITYLERMSAILKLEQRRRGCIHELEVASEKEMMREKQLAGRKLRSGRVLGELDTALAGLGQQQPQQPMGQLMGVQPIHQQQQMGAQPLNQHQPMDI